MLIKQGCCLVAAYTIYVVSCVLNKLYVFSVIHLPFLHLVEQEPPYKFWVSPIDGQLVPLLAVICVAVVMVLFTSNWVIHLHYYSQLLSLLPLSFSEHSQVYYPWKHSICPLDFDLWCIFWIIWKCFGQQCIAKRPQIF